MRCGVCGRGCGSALVSLRKLRDLASLPAKEIALHSFPSPQVGTALERLVCVLAITEPRLEKRAGEGQPDRSFDSNRNIPQRPPHALHRPRL